MVLRKGPKILEVETGYISDPLVDQTGLRHRIDYQVYENVPFWWRSIEEFLRFDLYLAFKVRWIANQYDIIYAMSEKVGLPLSFMRLKKPLVVVVHHLESPLKAKLSRLTGIAKQWSGVGYISNESRAFLINDLGVSPDRLFQYETAKYLDMDIPQPPIANGPIMSLGAAKRDYNTLINALIQLPDYETELFVSSKFGDRLKTGIAVDIPAWVTFPGFVTTEELITRYQQTRFVVVPLEETTHSGAGINVILEAGAFGKAVIATRTGGTQTFVKDGKTGILVPPNDVDAMRNAIQTLWTQPELAHQMGVAGRQYIESQYSPEKVAARIRALFKEIFDETTNCNK